MYAMNSIHLKKWIIPSIVPVLLCLVLIGSEAFFVDYALIILFYIFCVFKNSKSSFSFRDLSDHHRKLTVIFSLLFTSMITFSNYDLWTNSGRDRIIGRYTDLVINACVLAVLLICGIYVFITVFSSLCNCGNIISWRPGIKGIKPRHAFGLFFLLFVILRLILFFGCFYPGILTEDSINQLNQIISGAYINHHPYFHTRTIQCFFFLGYRLFGNINAAIAAFIVFQIIFMAICISFSFSTLSYLKAPRYAHILLGAFYLIIPVNILYTFSIWKDVMFAGFFIVFTMFLFRCITETGPLKFNYSILIISGLGVCLFRSNGLFSVFVSGLMMFIVFRKQKKNVFISVLSILVISFMLKHPLLGTLGIEDADILETIGIPIQQVSEVIYEGYELTDSETESLSKVIDPAVIPDNYLSYLVDPIKYLIREGEGQYVISENIPEYAKVYLSIGLRLPIVYIKTWINMTKGYWNAGYRYWVASTGTVPNDMGILNSIGSEFIYNMFSKYLVLFDRIPFFAVFSSIGLLTWINLILLFISIVRKDKTGICLCLPIAAVVLSLLIAAPSFAEFRYMYCAYITLPLNWFLITRPVEKTKSQDVIN